MSAESKLDLNEIKAIEKLQLEALNIVVAEFNGTTNHTKTFRSLQKNYHPDRYQRMKPGAAFNPYTQISQIISNIYEYKNDHKNPPITLKPYSTIEHYDNIPMPEGLGDHLPTDISSDSDEEQKRRKNPEDICSVDQLRGYDKSLAEKLKEFIKSKRTAINTFSFDSLYHRSAILNTYGISEGFKRQFYQLESDIQHFRIVVNQWNAPDLVDRFFITLLDPKEKSFLREDTRWDLSTEVIELCYKRSVLLNKIYCSRLTREKMFAYFFNQLADIYQAGIFPNDQLCLYIEDKTERKKEVALQYQCIGYVLRQFELDETLSLDQLKDILKSLREEAQSLSRKQLWGFVDKAIKHFSSIEPRLLDATLEFYQNIIKLFFPIYVQKRLNELLTGFVQAKRADPSSELSVAEDEKFKIDCMVGFDHDAKSLPDSLYETFRLKFIFPREEKLAKLERFYKLVDSEIEDHVEENQYLRTYLRLIYIGKYFFDTAVKPKTSLKDFKFEIELICIQLLKWENESYSSAQTNLFTQRIYNIYHAFSEISGPEEDKSISTNCFTAELGLFCEDINKRADDFFKLSPIKRMNSYLQHVVEQHCDYIFYKACELITSDGKLTKETKDAVREDLLTLWNFLDPTDLGMKDAFLRSITKNREGSSHASLLSILQKHRYIPLGQTRSIKLFAHAMYPSQEKGQVDQLKRDVDRLASIS